MNQDLERVWKVQGPSEQYGPYLKKEVEEWYRQNPASATWYIWRPGMANWKLVRDVFPDSSEELVPMPIIPPQMPSVMPEPEFESVSEVKGIGIGKIIAMVFVSLLIFFLVGPLTGYGLCRYWPGQTYAVPIEVSLVPETDWYESDGVAQGKSDLEKVKYYVGLIEEGRSSKLGAIHSKSSVLIEIWAERLAAEFPGMTVTTYVQYIGENEKKIDVLDIVVSDSRTHSVIAVAQTAHSEFPEKASNRARKRLGDFRSAQKAGEIARMNEWENPTRIWDADDFGDSTVYWTLGFEGSRVAGFDKELTGLSGRNTDLLLAQLWEKYK